MKMKKNLLINLLLLCWQLVAQGQFTVLKQPLGFIKILQWVSSPMLHFIHNKYDECKNIF